MYKKITFFSLLLWGCFGVLFASDTDSLLQQLKINTDTDKQLELLLDVGHAYQHEYEYEAASAYLNQAWELANQQNALSEQEQAAELLNANYYELGHLDSSEYFGLKSLEFNKQNNDAEGLSMAYNNLALIYHYRLQFDRSLEMYQNALRISEKENDRLGIALVNSNMGIIFGQLGNVEKAISYFENAYTIAQEIGDTLMEVTALLNIGRGNIELVNYPKADAYLQKALEIAAQLKDKNEISAVLEFLGLSALKQNQFEIAASYYRQSLNLYEQEGAKARMADVIANLAEIYNKQEDFAQSIQYGKNALYISEAISLNEVSQNVYKLLSKNYAELGDYQLGFDYQQKYINLRDSLFSDQQSQQVAEMQTKYETEKKEAENELLKIQSRQNDAIIRQKNYLNIAIGAILLLATLLAVFYYRNFKQKSAINQVLEEEVLERTAALRSANQQLSQSNAELKSFAYISSHDLKEPLRNISSYTSLLERTIDHSAVTETKEYIQLLKDNTQQMYRLIQDVLAYTTLGENATKERELVDLNAVMKQVKQALSEITEEKKVEINCDTLPTVKATSTELFLVLKNLIENGVKYNKNPNPVIDITTKTEDNKQIIAISDNGIGIAPEYHKRIFEMFKRLHTRSEYEGTGMGLAICQKIISRLNGTLTLESEQGKGSTFFITLPA